MKQMGLQSYFQQSPKAQTARDDKSGETSQDAQKTTAHSVKKEVEEGPSNELQQEAKEKNHTFRFCLNSKEYSVACKTSMTVLEALNTSKQFRSEKDKKKNIQKETLIQRSKGEVPGAAVKTDFPCCLIEKDELLDINFIPKDGNSSKNQTTADPSHLSKRSKPEALVSFWVKKEGGPKIMCLLKSKALRTRVRYVCVFAFKGEKVKTALKRDGRFNNVIFRKDCGLSEFGTETNHELSMPVEILDKKSFQVVVISDNIQPESQDDVPFVKSESNVASDADEEENVGPNQNEKKQDGNTTKSTNPSTKRYVAKRIDKSEEILTILRDQHKDLMETLKQRENLMNKPQVQKFFRTEYHKTVENFSEVKKVKELMRLSDSVCQIRVGESAIGTGFLLFDRFILTNAHVLEVSTSISSTVNVAQFTAVFDYEDKTSLIKPIPVKQLIAYSKEKDVSGRFLDYALLELDSDSSLVNEIAEYPKLIYWYSPNPPNRGQICIVGHPGEGVKKMDPCFIIQQDKRPDAVNEHAYEHKDLIHVMKDVNLKENWDFSAYKNQITYDSCFFHGSSGSPVFDADCNLIGIHTGGYKYKEDRHKIWSVMEYGFTIQPILENIKARAKIQGLHEIINILESYSDKSSMPGAAEQQYQKDILMVNAEESLMPE